MTVEPEAAADDPVASPLKFFGEEVKLERQRLNMTRAQLGEAAHCSYSLVAKIESGDRVPPVEFAQTCDRVFPNANGRYVRLWPLIVRFAYPPWFRPYVDHEEKATSIRMFHPTLLPGLVQTPDYARAVLRWGRPSNLEDLLALRMGRQRILAREDPPRLWLVLLETVLTTTVGEKEVMRAQLAKLRDLAETPAHRVQILRNGDRYCAPAASPFGLLGFDVGPDIVHVDGFPRGYILAEPEDVRKADDTYDLLAAMATPPDESAALIDSILKEHYS